MPPDDPVVPPVPPAAPWYASRTDVPPEIIGTWQNKGWDKDPAVAAIEATRAFREAEKFVGIPADQVLRMPKDAADEAGWKALRTRLGVPADPKEYDFATVKKTDGTDAPAGILDTVRAAAAANFLPKDAALGVAKALVAQAEREATAQMAERTAALAAQRQELDRNWGAQKDVHMVVAKQAAAALGVKPEEVAALEGVVGYARVMEMFRQIGAKIGEDKFVRGGPEGTTSMTREMAIDEKKRLMGDSEWSKKALAGDAEVTRQLRNLNELISGPALSESELRARVSGRHLT